MLLQVNLCLSKLSWREAYVLSVQLVQDVATIRKRNDVS